MQQMPFGKYKGQYLEYIDSDYLNWLAENIRLREPLRSAVLGELFNRDVYLDLQEDQGGIDQGKVKSVFKQLCLKYHPDTGGNHEAMIALNEFYEKLINS